ncbi:unnamed protein product [Didymodactylos carnosus]|uniref:Uncharacterized protein n=1 Tax=Didymodactylos carnosus TaxID=1234261 RepID=A0A8S2ERX8_9BILA|nr:unnamed protein product [Didymodactylos carnosus]CAF4095236.1 unnamed protein product [Didymodactylos carnosus]
MKGKHHWHIMKPCGTEVERIKNDDEEKAKKYRYRTKIDQAFYTYFTNYGQSLTTKDIKDNQLEIALYRYPERTEQKQETEAKISGKKRRILEEKDKADREKKVRVELEQMSIIEKMLETKINDLDRIEVIDRQLFPTLSSSIQTPNNRLKLLKRKMKYQQKLLLTTTRERTKNELEQLRIAYFATLTLITHLEDSMERCKVCSNVIDEKKHKCGNVMCNKDPFEQKKDDMKNILLLSSTQDASELAENWYRFQMELVNSQQPRAQNTTEDVRVTDFVPDEWQVKFLNAVDKRQSVVILAPTASGKTYASYYAMKTVINRSSNGLCVYVSPTKALVNQVGATVYNRCRILVTVPQSFEILLLSPNHQELRDKIEYVILDEIHCMGTEIGNDVWEKCMLTSNAPMIGLSATVNNGDAVHHWWTQIEKRWSELHRGSEREVVIITYNERLADLNKYLYSGKQLHSIHPIGLMNSKQLIDRGSLPVDLSLSPRETLQLYDAIRKTQRDLVSFTAKNDENSSTTTDSKGVSASLTDYFTDDWVIERSKCNKLSQDVQNQFATMIKEEKVELIDSIIKNINEGKKPIEYPESKNRLSLIVEFISTLRDRNLLPCIVFSDSRWLCEHNAKSVAQFLEIEEEKLRSGKYKSRMDEIKRKLEDTEKKKKKTGKTSTSGRKKKSTNHNDDDDSNPNEDNDDDEANNELNGADSDFYYNVLPECTLTHRSSDKSIAEYYLNNVSDTNSKLVKLIKRGIAYHHSGLNSKGRVAVEALFRNRYIQVVFSTATLALGIHMPAKTVAFTMDSVHLDALNYRQASGRSGRRGFDVQGKSD